MAKQKTTATGATLKALAGRRNDKPAKEKSSTVGTKLTPAEVAELEEIARAHSLSAHQLRQYVIRQWLADYRAGRAQVQLEEVTATRLVVRE